MLQRHEWWLTIFLSTLSTCVSVPVTAAFLPIASSESVAEIPCTTRTYEFYRLVFPGAVPRTQEQLEEKEESESDEGTRGCERVFGDGKW